MSLPVQLPLTELWREMQVSAQKQHCGVASARQSHRCRAGRAGTSAGPTLLSAGPRDAFWGQSRKEKRGPKRTGKGKAAHRGEPGSCATPGLRANLPRSHSGRSSCPWDSAASLQRSLKVLQNTGYHLARPDQCLDIARNSTRPSKSISSHRNRGPVTTYNPQDIEPGSEATATLSLSHCAGSALV